jgi:proteasome beta subunit
MTLIVALGCSDGIVMGADSASTDSISGTKQPVIKIQQIGSSPILCGGSGDVGLLQKITDELHALSIPSAVKFKNVRQAIRRTCLPEMKEATETHIRQPVRGYDFPPTATFLFACIQHKLPFILEVDIDGRDTVYDKNYGFFNAIGSGKAFAQAIMRPHLTRERDLRLGKIQAYRIVEDSIELAASGLSKPIHLYTLELDGKITKLGDEELTVLQSQCELWRELEREALGKLLAPTTEEEPEALVPEPEPETEVRAKAEPE